MVKCNMKKILPIEFYKQHTEVVAIQLLGKYLMYNNKLLLVTETECYHGFDDKAAHTYRGKPIETK